MVAFESDVVCLQTNADERKNLFVICANSFQDL